MYPNQAAANASLLAMCEEIASHLGAYEVLPQGGVVRLRGNDGIELHAYFGGRPLGDRIAIRAALPMHATDWQRQQAKPKIIIATSEGAERIAERITADLLPGYLAVLDEMRAEHERIAALEVERNRVISTILAVIPTARRGQHSYDKDEIVLHAGGTDALLDGTPLPGQIRLTATLGLESSNLLIRGLDELAITQIAAAVADFLDRHDVPSVATDESDDVEADDA